MTDINPQAAAIIYRYARKIADEPRTGDLMEYAHNRMAAVRAARDMIACYRQAGGPEWREKDLTKLYAMADSFAADAEFNALRLAAAPFADRVRQLRDRLVRASGEVATAKGKDEKIAALESVNAVIDGLGDLLDGAQS